MTRIILVGIAAFVSYLTGPGSGYLHCPECASLVDADQDGDVDMRDFQVWQNSWECRETIDGPLLCGGSLTPGIGIWP